MTTLQELTKFWGDMVRSEMSIIRICAWCPDARQQTLTAARAMADGAIVSHTICAACQEKINAQLNDRR